MLTDENKKNKRCYETVINFYNKTFPNNTFSYTTTIFNNNLKWSLMVVI